MKSNLDNLFKTDKSFEKDGIWMDISDDVGFLVKRFGGYNSSELKKAMATKYKPFARQIKNGTLSADKEKRIMTELFVTTSLVDWKGVKINDEEKAFDKELAVEFLLGLPDLLEALTEHASDSDNYREDLGN